MARARARARARDAGGPSGHRQQTNTHTHTHTHTRTHTNGLTSIRSLSRYAAVTRMGMSRPSSSAMFNRRWFRFSVPSSSVMEFTSTHAGSSTAAR